VSAERKNVLIVVQDMTSPLDRRVWLEASTLSRSKYSVVILCPNSKMYPRSRETIDGITIYRYPQIVEGKSVKVTVIEYLSAMFFLTVFQIWILINHKINFIHYCNPPDFLISFGLLVKKIIGTRIVFDQHDLTPELLLIKGFSKKSLTYKILNSLERMSLQNADAVIFASGSFQDKAKRNNLPATGITAVIKTAPKRDFCKSVKKIERGDEETKYSLGYIGRMGRQDNLQTLLEAFAIVVYQFGLDNIKLKLVGDGPEYKYLIKLADKLALTNHVDFFGYVSDESKLGEVMKECTIAICPDFPNEMNNKSSMNKITEYMALELPIIQFNLIENVKTCGGFSKVVEDNNANALASAIVDLLKDEKLRETMAKGAKDRFLNHLCWESQEEKLLDIYTRLSS